MIGLVISGVFILDLQRYKLLTRNLNNKVIELHREEYGLIRLSGKEPFPKHYLEKLKYHQKRFHLYKSLCLK